MLKRKYRLKQRQAFRQIYRRGLQSKCRGFAIHCLKNKLNHNRLGVVVGTKVSKKAVVRNRIRRRLHGIVGEFWSQLSPGNDLIIRVSDDLSIQDTQELRENIRGCLKKLRVLN